MDESADVIRPIRGEAERLDPRQRAVHASIQAGLRGTVAGPLLVWLLSPEFAERAQALGEFCRYRTALPVLLSELAILVVGSHWQAGFEWHVHAPIAYRAGLDSAAVEAIWRGAEPELQGPQKIVYQFCRALLEKRDIDDELYASAVIAVGRAAVVELV